MSKSARTIQVYSFYLFALGSGMMIVPNLLLSIFGFPATTEIGIRMLGLFTFTTGIYYFHSARHEQREFFRATIYGRLFFFVVTVLLTIVFAQSPMLVAIGGVDLVGALWTYRVMQQSPDNPA